MDRGHSRTMFMARLTAAATHEVRNVLSIVKASDLFLFPSLFEGLGVALLEAMALRAACIASDTGPMNETLEHGVSGLHRRGRRALVGPPGGEAHGVAGIGVVAARVDRERQALRPRKRGRHADGLAPFVDERHVETGQRALDGALAQAQDEAI